MIKKEIILIPVVEDNTSKIIGVISRLDIMVEKVKERLANTISNSDDIINNNNDSNSSDNDMRDISNLQHIDRLSYDEIKN